MIGQLIKKIQFFWLVSIFSLVFLTSLAIAQSPSSPNCGFKGNYGYIQHGTVYQENGGEVDLAETGTFSVDGIQNIVANASVTFRFSNFPSTGFPLWLLVNIDFEGTYTIGESCTGTANFLSTGTVLASSNEAIIPPGSILFSNNPRSVEFTIAGSNGETVNFISTSVNTVASGVATKRH